MRIIFVRHGKMAGDPYVEPERPVSGCLSEAGVSQAKATARALAGTPIDAAFSSPYGRALQTAEIVLEGRDVPITIVAGLKEWQPDPAYRDSAITEYERIASQLAEKHAEEKWKTPLGEGCFDMYARMVPAFLSALAQCGIHNRMGGFVPDEGAGETAVAVFAHGGTLNVLLSFVLHSAPFPVGRFSFDLAGYAEVEFSEHGGVHYPHLRLRAPRSGGDA